MGLRSINALQYTSEVIVVPCCMNFIISTSFLSQKTAVTRILADNICLDFSGSLVNVCASTALIVLGFNIQNRKPGFITC
jgi:hypothetical protein